MGIAWKVLLPLVLLNILVTAFIRLVGNGQITDRRSVVWIAIIVVLGGAGADHDGAAGRSSRPRRVG